MGLFDFLRRRLVGSGGVSTSSPSDLRASIGARGALSVEVIPSRGAPQHRLDVLCVEHQATYDRTREENHMVRLRLYLPSGDVIVGRGPTTPQAIQDLDLKLVAWQEASRAL